MRFIRLFVLLMSVNAWFIDAAYADPLLRVGADILYNDNVNNGSAAADIKADSAESIQAEVGRIFTFADDGAFSVAGTLAAQKFNRFDGLDHTDIGVATSYSRKLGLGRDMPRLFMSAAAAHADYRNSVRDGWAYSANIGISQYLSERWQARLSYLINRFDSDTVKAEVPTLSGAAFDQIAHSVAVDASYFYSSSTAITLGYSRRSGDVTATTRPGLAVYRVSSALAEDDVFGDEFYAYRLRAITHDLYVGASEAVSEQSSVNLRYQRRISHGREDFNYYNSIFSLSWLYAY